MSKPLRILILEDSAADAEMNLHELRRAGFDPQWTREEKQLLNGSFPGSICWSTLPFPHDERPQD